MILDGLFNVFERRDSLENPAIPLTGRNVERLLGGGNSTSSGVTVNRETAFMLPSFWRGVTLISGTIGKVPLITYRDLGGEGAEPDRNHPAYYLLKRQANQYQTASQMKRLLTAHGITKGNGYAYVFRGGDGLPESIWPLDPDATYPLIVRYAGMQPLTIYMTTLGNGEQRKLMPEDVLHIKGLGWDGLCGMSVIRYGREAIGVGLATQKFGATFFGNGTKASGVLMFPGHVNSDAAEEITADWHRKQAGLSNAHKTILLEDGVKYQQLSINPDDAQFLGTMEHNVRAIANLLGLPPHKLGDNSRTAYNSLEEENQSSIDDCYDHWFTEWENECWAKLLQESEKHSESHKIEFKRQALLRANLTARGEYYTKATGGKAWMVPNEVRALENENPIDGGDDLPAEPAPAAPPPGPSAGSTQPARNGDAARQVFERAQRGMRLRLASQARKAAKDPGNFLKWLDGPLALDNRETVFDALLSPVAILLNCEAAAAATAADRTATSLFNELHAELLESAGTVQAVDLLRAVDAVAERFENNLTTIEVAA